MYLINRPVAVGICLLLLWNQGLLGRDRQAAREAFEQASNYYQRLMARDESERTPGQYRRAIFLFRRVVDHDPTFGASDDALYRVATLYDEMASRYRNEAYKDRASYYYEFVAREYPLTKYRNEALARVQTLRSPPPDQNFSGQAASNKSSTPGHTSAEADPQPDADNLSTLNEVRYWSSEDYTRVVLQMDREVKFEKGVLRDPDRIYFDLNGARLQPGMEARDFEVNGLFIKKVRVGENRPGVVRVVLDFEKINRHTVFALYDPYRIVIDTRGDKRQTVQEEIDRNDSVRTAEAVIPLNTDEGKREEVSNAIRKPAPNLEGDLSLTRVLGLKVGKVVIDAGHGGKDTGTIGPNGLKEKDLVLDIALRLSRMLKEQLGVEVILTRKEDVFVPLEERTAIANQQGADLFISIHANASRNRKVSGVETFILDFATTADERDVASRENAGAQRTIRELEDLLRQIALGDYNHESRDLARLVQKHLHLTLNSKGASRYNRGVKQAPFIVLIGSNMPSILTEIGFISNPREELYFRDSEGRNEVAAALYGAIEEYFQALGSVPAAQRAAQSGP